MSDTMSDGTLADSLQQYRAGLEAEIAILGQLQTIARRQREDTASRDFERFAAESEVRERLTRSLVKIEEGLRVIRGALTRGRTTLVSHPAYAQVVALRRSAEDMVARILATDEESMKALADAELARRSALASLERGEITLAAYRKVIAPPVSIPTLLDRLG